MKKAKLKGKREAETKFRRCLMCGCDFESSWAGERVCKRCRSSHNWRQGAAAVGRPLGHAAPWF
jgi:hypothetical protein